MDVACGSSRVGADSERTMAGDLAARLRQEENVCSNIAVLSEPESPRVFCESRMHWPPIRPFRSLPRLDACSLHLRSPLVRCCV